jgi:hypothetical protein
MGVERNYNSETVGVREENSGPQKKIRYGELKVKNWIN